MKSIFNYNFENGTEYVQFPFDEKNLSTDMLEEFLLDNNTAVSKSSLMIVGFGTLPLQKEEVFAIEWGGNIAKWHFTGRRFIDYDDVTTFCAELQEYLKEGSANHIAFTATVEQYEQTDNFKNHITVTFYAKVN